MLSVVIVSNNDAPVLARMFAPLITGAAQGLVRDVILSDASAGDESRAIADAAGCTIVESAPGWRTQITAGEKAARGEWLLCLKAGAIAQPGWIEDVQRFLERGDAAKKQAFFRVTYEEDGAAARFAEATAWARRDVLGAPLPQHGLLATRANLHAKAKRHLLRAALMFEFVR